eukprot:GHVR01109035.1.p1 GENE.GHVR01109035.1~~GHVR01109035.1.p1  ORF type:complete len:134 (-),score=32.59 GHVR01109035.1:43-444(-)
MVSIGTSDTSSVDTTPIATHTYIWYPIAVIGGAEASSPSNFRGKGRTAISCRSDCKPFSVCVSFLSLRWTTATEEGGTADNKFCIDLSSRVSATLFCCFSVKPLTTHAIVICGTMITGVVCVCVCVCVYLLNY